MPDDARQLLIDAVAASQSLSDSLQILLKETVATQLSTVSQCCHTVAKPNCCHTKVGPRCHTVAKTMAVPLLLMQIPEIRAFASEFLEWTAACGARDEQVIAMFRDSGITEGNITQADHHILIALTLGWTRLDYNIQAYLSGDIEVESSQSASDRIL